MIFSKTLPGNCSWGAVISFITSLALLCVLAISLINFESVPRLWWDEGWTLLVAKNWVMQGHYGQINNGALQSAGLSAAFPVVAPVALSFRIFGVGILQARGVAVVITLLTLALTIVLARKVFGRRNAILTFFIIVAIHKFPTVSVIYWGRQVLAEMTMIGFLVAGHLAWLASPKRPRMGVILASICWGLALQSKLQALPFWLISFFFALGFAWSQRQTIQAKRLLIIGIASAGIYFFFPLIEQMIVGPGYIPKSPIPGLFQVTAIVLSSDVRLVAWNTVLAVGIPTLIGFCYAFWQLFPRHWSKHALLEVGISRVALFGFAASWILWYVLLAASWDRYLFPPIFIATPFLAALVDAACRFENWRGFFERLRYRFPSLASGNVNLARLTHLFVLSMFSFSAVMIGLDNYFRIKPFLQKPDHPGIVGLWNVINQGTEAYALIESYDSEVFVGIDRSYHYPPDSLSVDRIDKNYKQDNTPPKYTLPQVEPLYVVVGPFSEMWNMYNLEIASGELILWHSFPGYKIYRSQSAP